MSETAKYRHLTRPYCYRDDGEPGVGLDIASQGDPVVPWAWQLDLPQGSFRHYSGGLSREGRGIQLSGDASDVAEIDSESLDFIYCSHFLEDLRRDAWPFLFKEWARCLKTEGNLIILVPERERWQAAIARGQTPNCSHYGPEPVIGDITRAAGEAGNLVVLFEKLTDLTPEDYTIWSVMKKI